MRNQQVKEFNDEEVRRKGINAQRKYPNEFLIRFIASKYFSLCEKERKNIRILEVGCGTGANTRMLADEGFDVYAIDISENSVEITQNTLDKLGLAAEVIVMDMMNMSFPDNLFDAVVSVFSNSCLPSFPYAAFLKEAARVLKPNGWYYSFEPSVKSDAFINFEPAEKIDDYTLNGIYREDSPYCGNHYPFRFADEENEVTNLTRAGFSDINIERIGRTSRNRQEYFEFLSITGRRK